MELDAFPTRVMLMAEYGGGLPLWDKSPSTDLWFGPFDRGLLGLSTELEARLVRWNVGFDTLLGSNFEWPSSAEHLAFVVDGHLLAADLQREFGTSVLVLYLEDDSERSRIHWPEQPDADGWTARGAAGGALSGGAPRRKTIAEQMWEMPDAEFAALTRTVDVASLLWQPGRAPSRILLRPQADGLPLLDRSALAGRPTDVVDPSTLSLSDGLVARLRDWNDRWRAVGPAAPTEYPTEYLIEGHVLAAALQQEVGPNVPVLFPEADAARSAPSEEMAQFVTRLLGRGDDGSTPAD